MTTIGKDRVLLWDACIAAFGILVLLSSCSTSKKGALNKVKVDYPQGYLSSYYDAFRQMYLNDGQQSPAGFDELVQRYPDSAEAHLMRADAYMKFRNFEEARRSVDRSIELDSMNPSAYAMRSDVKLMQREPIEEVLKDELRCLQLDSTNSSYIQRSIFHLHDAKMYDECIALALKNYRRHNEGGVIDVVLASCYVGKNDRESAKKYLDRFAAREDTSPELNGFALLSAMMLDEGDLIELFYARDKQGGCVSVRDIMIFQAYLKHSGDLGRAFNEGATMVASCDYDTSDVERMLQSLSPIGVLDSTSMAEGLHYADILLARYSRSDVVLGFAETMYRKVKDTDRTYALLRRSAERDSSDFLRWALLLEFEDFHSNEGGHWVRRTPEDWQNAAKTYPIAQWGELTQTHRYMLRKFPNSVSAVQYLVKLYTVTQSYDVVRDTACNYIDYYKRCLKRAKKGDTIYYHGAAWGPRLSADEAYRKVISSLYSYVGDQYMYRQMRPQAYKEYRQGLKYDPDNAMLLNNYAYFLAKDPNSKRIKLAERMSKRCITLEPNNATYLDTYAYILFLRGDYERAKSFYAKLFSLGEVQSAEVYRNYSELLEAMGNKTTAEVYRMKAKGLEEKQQ